MMKKGLSSIRQKSISLKTRGCCVGLWGLSGDLFGGAWFHPGA